MNPGHTCPVGLKVSLWNSDIWEGPEDGWASLTQHDCPFLAPSEDFAITVEAVWCGLHLESDSWV